MNWQTYKQLSDTPSVVSRWLLIQTRTLVPASLQPRIDTALAQPPLEKPPGHIGDERSDMLTLDWPSEEVAAVLHAVERAAESGERLEGGRSLAGFVEAWREYANFQSELGE